jgi:hypothetical protein
MGAGSGGSGGSSRYELRAPLAGVVVEKHLTVGESVTESTASFTVSNLSAVWAEINVAAPQLPYVRVGAPVTVRATAFESAAEGKIAYVGALIGEQTRTAPARVALANPKACGDPVCLWRSRSSRMPHRFPSRSTPRPSSARMARTTWSSFLRRGLQGPARSTGALGRQDHRSHRRPAGRTGLRQGRLLPAEGRIGQGVCRAHALSRSPHV